MVIGDILKRNAKLYPEKVGLKFEGSSWTFCEINARVNQLAAAFIHLGLKKGERVGILERNCPEYIDLYFATAKSGNVIVPISPRISKDEIVFLLKDSGVKIFIVGKEFVEMIRKIRQELTDIVYFICIGDKEVEDFLNYEKLISSMPSVEPEIDIKENDPSMIMYTSGSTGRPKGVVTTHKNNFANTITMTLELQVQHEDVTLIVMPLYHNGGLWPTLVHFYRGAQIILQRRFEEKDCLSAIQKEKVTTFNLVPIMLLRLLEYPDLPKYKWDSLRLIFYGGAPMPIPVLRKALEYFGNRFMTGLGLTEASGGILFLQKNDLILEGPEKNVRRLGSVGKDALNVVIRIIDEDGKDIEPDEIGEIIAKGDNIAPEYWNLPEETINTIKNGWLYTGDLATVDKDGYVYVVDRAKDIIISGGENISSKEVEDVIYTHPDVSEVAVIGIPDEKWGEAVHVVVVPKKNAVNFTENDVIEYCKKHLASFKKPKSVEFISELPRNILGKVEKKKLKAKFWEGLSKSVH